MGSTHATFLHKSYEKLYHRIFLGKPSTIFLYCSIIYHNIPEYQFTVTPLVTVIKSSKTNNIYSYWLEVALEKAEV